MAAKKKTTKEQKVEPTIRLFTLAKVLTTLKFEDWLYGVHRKLKKAMESDSKDAIPNFEKWFNHEAVPELYTFLQDVDQFRTNQITIEQVMQLDIE